MQEEKLYISKKLSKIIELFNSNQTVTLWKVMAVWKYKDWVAAFQRVVDLAREKIINVGYNSYKWEFVKMEDNDK